LPILEYGGCFKPPPTRVGSRAVGIVLAPPGLANALLHYGQE